MKKLLLVFLILATLISVTTSVIAEEETSKVEWGEYVYLDQFGDKTNQKVVSPTPFEGFFSNSATQNSELYVIFYIESPKKMSFQLFEYGEDGYLVTEYRKTKYLFEIKDEAGKITKLEGNITTDTLILTQESAQKLHKLLLNNKTLSIFIQNGRYKTSTYRFKIEDTTGYEKALEYLK